MATDPPPNTTSPRNGTSCNLVTVSILLAVPLFSFLGYRYGSSSGTGAGVAGAVGGFFLGVLLAPLLFLVLVSVSQLAIRLQDRRR